MIISLTLSMHAIDYLTNSCAIKNSKYSSCLIVGEQANSSLYADNQQQALPLQSENHKIGGFISDNEMLIGLDPMRPNELPNPIWFNTLCLLGFFVLFRLLGYLVLRIYHKPS